MTTILVAVFAVLSTISGRFVDALECYSCNNVDSVNRCTSTAHCSDDESCFLEVTNSVYRLGCVSNKQCGGFSSVASSIVGRSVTNGRDVKQRDANHCFECCGTNVCNIPLCQYANASACIDDAKADCAWMNSKFNICHNVHEAKSVCPRFCGLCTLVDGNWAGWSSWSRCDVSCANGTQTRTRQCTNPTPVSGGLECPGSTIESRPCSFSPCPVTPTVAFRSKDLTSLTITNSALVFPAVMENIGNGYNSQSGKFTAPLPGTYLFSAQLCLEGSHNNYFTYGIYHNGLSIKTVTITGHQYTYCDSVDTYAILRVNDTVWVQSLDGSGSLYKSLNYWNMFSGVLIHI